MPGVMCIRVWDVEHGCCAMLQHIATTTTGRNVGGRLAMIDSGSSADFRPSTYIKEDFRGDKVDYLFITSADQDHMSDLQGLEDAGIKVGTLIRNPSYTASQIRNLKLVSGPLSMPDPCTPAWVWHRTGEPMPPLPRGYQAVSRRGEPVFHALGPLMS